MAQDLSAVVYNFSFGTDSGTTTTGTFAVNYSDNIPTVIAGSVSFTAVNSNFDSVTTGTSQIWLTVIDRMTETEPSTGLPKYPDNTFQLSAHASQPNYLVMQLMFRDNQLDGTITTIFNNQNGETLYYNFNVGDLANAVTGLPTQIVGNYSQTYDPSCFTPGTLISTPTGSTPVRELAIGDLILNHAGQSVPVKWIGIQSIHPAFIGDGLPICISGGALGNGLPLRDLYVSPHHAMYVDDCLLIEAKALINGTTITQVTQWEGDVQYFHIETEHHEIILAEGAPAETFMDNVSRANFNNYSEYQALYPEAHEMIELDIPRISHQRQLSNVIKAKLDAVAQGLMGQERVQMQA